MNLSSRTITAGLTCAWLFVACHSNSQPPQRGQTQRRPPVAAVRVYQVVSPAGTRRDDYYWLRDDTRSSKDVLQLLQQENAYTDAMLAHTKPLQEQLYTEITARIKQDDTSVPYRKKGYWYYRRYEIGKEYPIFARKHVTLAAAEQIMLDGNELAKGHGYFQVGEWQVSPDNRMLAWAEDSCRPAPIYTAHQEP